MQKAEFGEKALVVAIVILLVLTIAQHFLVH